jgi:hypothetical protein
MATYFYVAPNLGEAGGLDTDELAATEDRHKVTFTTPATAVCLDPRAELERRPTVAGVLIGLNRGWPGPAHLRLATFARQRRLRVWLFWPEEQAVEHLDDERIASFWRHWCVISLHRVRAGISRRIWGPEPTASKPPDVIAQVAGELQALVASAAPVPFPAITPPPAVPAIGGRGMYLRTDFWVNISSGGSYGHTCYVAKELAATSRGLSCVMANRYELLDHLGLHQIVVPPPSRSSNEIDLLGGTAYFTPLLNIAA